MKDLVHLDDRLPRLENRTPHTRVQRHPPPRWCMLALGALLLAGCGKVHSKTGSSETHFLMLCESDACGGDLSCVCGVCSQACVANAACEEFASGAQCVASQADSCEQPRTCDVQCIRDADCRRLGARHTCSDGRCREPAAVEDAGVPPNCSGPGCGGDGGTPVPDGCELDAVAALLSGGELSIACGTLTLGASSAEVAAAFECVLNAYTNGEPFHITWAVQGMDSAVHQGFAAVRDQTALVVYSLLSDSLGFGGTIGLGDLTVQSTWTPCATFALAEACTGTLEECLICAPQPRACGCVAPAASGQAPTVQCAAPIVIDPPPCAAGSCEFDGVCYPETASTEDGCCSCEGGNLSCIEPGWCPGLVLIGQRCQSDLDCGNAGLSCRTNFAGERGLCTRDCNYGCPTGTECVAQVPDYLGGTIDNVCMRPCTTQADCMIDIGAVSLASECDMPRGLTASYCF